MIAIHEIAISRCPVQLASSGGFVIKMSTCVLGHAKDENTNNHVDRNRRRSAVNTLLIRSVIRTVYNDRSPPKRALFRRGTRGSNPGLRFWRPPCWPLHQSPTGESSTPAVCGCALDRGAELAGPALTQRSETVGAGKALRSTARAALPVEAMQIAVLSTSLGVSSGSSEDAEAHGGRDRRQIEALVRVRDDSGTCHALDRSRLAPATASVRRGDRTPDLAGVDRALYRLS